MSNDETNEEKGSFRRKIPSFGWILSKKHGKRAIFFCALRGLKILILLNLAQKSLFFHPPLLGHSEEYTPMNFREKMFEKAEFICCVFVELDKVLNVKYPSRHNEFSPAESPFFLSPP